MDVRTDPAEVRSACLAWRAQGKIVALVPTMGFFHAGHLALMERARELADKVVVSLFVNPAQFGAGEDLAAYPRDFERDARLARERGVDLLFAPEPEAMYPEGPDVWVEVETIPDHLCGAGRPGHFRGVATVVAKLLVVTLPHFAVFGEKDRQQLAVIRRLAEALFLPTEIVGHEIVREADGLAMSSRNVYLEPDERKQAPAIRRGLEEMAGWAGAGERDAEQLTARLRGWYARHLPAATVEYVSLVAPDTMQPVAFVDGPVVAAVALRLGRARLIDNLAIEV